MDGKENNKKSANETFQRNLRTKFSSQSTNEPHHQSNTGFASASDNRKRRTQPVRQTTLKNFNYSSTSSDDEADDSVIEYCRPQNYWRPTKCNDEHVSKTN